jgi:hypothetical protein
VCPPIATVYIDSYCTVNKIHATHIWVFMLPILGVFIDCRNRLEWVLLPYVQDTNGGCSFQLLLNRHHDLCSVE